MEGWDRSRQGQKVGEEGSILRDDVGGEVQVSEQGEKLALSTSGAEEKV